MATCASDISNSPLFLISERSCNPVLASALILNLPFVFFMKSRPDSILSQRLQRLPARKFRLRAQFLLDPQQLIVLGGAVGARQRAGFDLPAIGGDCEVGDSGILGFAGAVRHHGGV